MISPEDHAMIASLGITAKVVLDVLNDNKNIPMWQGAMGYYIDYKGERFKITYKRVKRRVK